MFILCSRPFAQNLPGSYPNLSGGAGAGVAGFQQLAADGLAQRQRVAVSLRQRVVHRGGVERTAVAGLAELGLHAKQADVGLQDRKSTRLNSSH